jgi:hypothetical protein
MAREQQDKIMSQRGMKSVSRSMAGPHNRSVSRESGRFQASRYLPSVSEPAPEYVYKLDENQRARDIAVKRLNDLEAMEADMLDNLRRSYKNGENAMDRLKVVVGESPGAAPSS